VPANTAMNFLVPQTQEISSPTLQQIFLLRIQQKFITTVSDVNHLNAVTQTCRQTNSAQNNVGILEAYVSESKTSCHLLIEITNPWAFVNEY
jgi:hypothetical protein